MIRIWWYNDSWLDHQTNINTRRSISFTCLQSDVIDYIGLNMMQWLGWWWQGLCLRESPVMSASTSHPIMGLPNSLNNKADTPCETRYSHRVSTNHLEYKGAQCGLPGGTVSLVSDPFSATRQLRCFSLVPSTWFAQSKYLMLPLVDDYY